MIALQVCAPSLPSTSLLEPVAFTDARKTASAMLRQEPCPSKTMKGVLFSHISKTGGTAAAWLVEHIFDNRLVKKESGLEVLVQREGGGWGVGRGGEERARGQWRDGLEAGPHGVVEPIVVARPLAADHPRSRHEG